MSWLFPGFLAAGALIALPVLLHFLRAKPKTIVPFPSLRFLGASAIRDTRSHRLRRWITLFLRCAIIALIAGAFARPFWIAQQEKSRRAMVVAVDNSMSMRADGRWNRAMGWAVAQLAELSASDRAGILLMHPTPGWLVPPGSSPYEALAALRAVEPGYEATRYGPALALCANVLAADPAGSRTLVWMGDQQASGWDEGSLSRKLSPGIAFRPFDPQNAPTRQIAISDLAWVPGRETQTLQATISNFGQSPIDCDLVARLDDVIVGTKTQKLERGVTKALMELASVGSETGAISVSVSAVDPLPEDDVAFILSERQQGRKVFVDSALGAKPGAQWAGDDFVVSALQATRRLGGLEVLPLPDAEWPGEATVILRGNAVFADPIARARLDRFVAQGGALLLFAGDFPETHDWLKTQGVGAKTRTETDAQDRLRDWDPEHPILQVFAGQSLLPLLETGFRRGMNLSGEILIPVASWPDGTTAIGECTEGGRRILIMGFAPSRDKTDLVTRAAFVPLLHQTVLWLGELRSARRDWRVGDLVKLPNSVGKWSVVQGPASHPPREVTNEVIAEAPGIFSFESGGERKLFAINLPPEESDLSPLPKPERLAALESRNQPVERLEANRPTPHGVVANVAEQDQQIWWWLLAGVGMLLLAELGLANRTTL